LFAFHGSNKNGLNDLPGTHLRRWRRFLLHFEENGLDHDHHHQNRTEGTYDGGVDCAGVCVCWAVAVTVAATIQITKI
jgi:hypothetical protein